VRVPWLICPHITQWDNQEQDSLLKVSLRVKAQKDDESRVTMRAINELASMRAAARECVKQKSILMGEK
jgi:hypothetical protein